MSQDRRDALVRHYLDEVFNRHDLSGLDKYLDADLASHWLGIPLWFGWEYARPTWTTGVITGTEVRRSDPGARGNTTDIEYIYMRTRSDRGLGTGFRR